jgi:hypothetical protein
MKRILLIFSLLCNAVLFAQVPQGISYQALALSPQGYPVGNTLIGVRLSILDSSITGSTIYTETHTTTTNDRGLYNLVIGQGSPVTGLFPLTNWGTNSKFLKLELDTTGGTNYVLVGTTQLWSVPYALHAERANSIDASNIDGTSTYSYTTGFITDSKAYYLDTVGNNNWISYAITGTPLAVRSTYNTVGYLTSTNAYVCTLTGDLLTPQWFSINLSGTPLKMIHCENSIAVLTTTHAYVFSLTNSSSNVSTYSWYTQALSGLPKDIYGYGSSDIGVVTDTNAYVFATTNAINTPEITASWYTTALNGSVIKVRQNYQLFTVYTTTHAYSMTPITTTGGNSSFEWKSVQMEGNYIDSAK